MGKPIFIIGSGRSGTSVITGALIKGGGINGYLEGHFLPLIMFLMKDIERYYFSKRQLLTDERHLLTHLSQNDIEEEILEMFRQRCETLCPSETWLDKSPDSAMIKAVPYLLRIWPDARFILAKRRGIENIQSRLKKFPHVSFEDHCILWKDCIASWLNIRKTLSPTCYIEVDQREIALQPKVMAEKIGNFLGLEPERIAKIEHIFTHERPQSTGGVEELKAQDIKEVGWTDEQIEIFRKHCGKVSEKFGYSESSSYYLETTLY
ncbi:hypothetical protein NO108_01292 [Planktothrix rubescens]|nr:hypothetical protein NO108_01292 [Planktothrix rubescens]CAH2572520.1 hypothetical protein PRNO82_01924 [Planktothrix rubescens]